MHTRDWDCLCDVIGIPKPQYMKDRPKRKSVKPYDDRNKGKLKYRQWIKRYAKSLGFKVNIKDMVRI